MKRIRLPDPRGDSSKRIEKCFQRFRLGMSVFFIGMVTLYGAENLLQPSLQQEIVAALALFVVAGGISLALIAELFFIGYRVLQFFYSNND